MKKEVNEQEAKEFKKGVVKKGLAMGLVSATCAIMAGCNILSMLPKSSDNSSNHVSNSESYQSVISSESISRDSSSESGLNASESSSGLNQKTSDTSNETNESSSSGSSDVKGSDPVPYEDLAKLIHKIETSSYQYASYIYEGDEIVDTIGYCIQGDNTRVTKSGKYYANYYNVDGAYYVYIVDENDNNKYYKYCDEDKLENSSIILNTLRSTNWVNCDAQRETVTGISNGKTYSLDFSGYDRWGRIKVTGDINGSIAGIGTTRFSNPEDVSWYEVVDKTSETLKLKATKNKNTAVNNIFYVNKDHSKDRD